jgi:hypothetical protein
MAGRQASAVIVRARLPTGLERLRRRSVADAIEVIAADGGPWRAVGRIRLGRVGRR